ncbi:hypothetical protein SAMN05216503_2883 [Polaribacter sp. KT25b]|nr:hypothetical protein SAMN05216503_2883 [Polaribacter sp. KT25b]
MYFPFSIGISVVHYFGLGDDLLIFSTLFLSIILVNIQGLRVFNPNNKKLKFILFSLLPLVLYLLFLIIYKENYFILYKVLIVIPCLFSLFQIFKNFKFGNN